MIPIDAQSPDDGYEPVYRRYRRTQVAEMADWVPGFDMSNVSVSSEDAKHGSPKQGDKIARNPANHDDRWLVAADYFVANFGPIEPNPLEQVAELQAEVERLKMILRRIDVDALTQEVVKRATELAFELNREALGELGT